jgi:CRISPR/Cas system-associated endonuclease Cas3-HD
MELKSRIVFIDTSIYKQKNYQFGQYSLAKLQKLVSKGDLTLLITDITISEIKSGCKQLAEKITLELNNVKNKTTFLRDIPELAYDAFFKKLGDDNLNIYAILENKFNDLINNDKCEKVLINTVNIEEVFNRYFNKQPPFGGGKKKCEFPDAFVLEAIRNSQYCQYLGPVYIVSTDTDMKKYADEFKDKLIHIYNIKDIIDAVNKNDKNISKNLEFVNAIFASLENKMKNTAVEYLKEGNFETVALKHNLKSGNNVDYNSFIEFDFSDFDNNWEIDIENIEISHKNLIDLDFENDSACYEVVFDCLFEISYSVPDYSRSPWDLKDKTYVFIFENQTIRLHHEKYSAYVDISYYDKLKANAEIENIAFVDSTFYLHEKNIKEESYAELDINGDPE